MKRSSVQVTSTIIGRRLAAIVDDMAATLANTAHSPRISVRRQFACALLDAEANVVVSNHPRYLASLEATTRQCIDAFRFDLADDDVILANDPYGGTPSIHYFSLVAPAKLGRDTTAFVTVQAHMSDIGGWVIGNYDPTAHEVRTEGLRITPMKIIKFGRRRRDVIETIILNGRLGTTLEGDLEAMLAALRLGQRELPAIAARYGGKRLTEAMVDVMEYAERRTRAALSHLPRGTYEGEASVRIGASDYVVRAQLRVADSTTLDFSATDSQASIFVNCVPPIVKMQALTPLFGILGDDIPWNSGILRAVDFRFRDGTLVAPNYPAPTGWSLEHVGTEVAEAVRQAVAKALSGSTAPGLPRRDLVFTVRRERRIGSAEEQLAVTDLSPLAQPGSSAGFGGDAWGEPGPEALGQLPSVEQFEQDTELTIRKMEYRCDSGGAGTWRGNPGVSTVIEFPADHNEYLYAVAASANAGPPGISGGRAGMPGTIRLIDSESCDTLTDVVCNRRLSSNATLCIDSAGGGGFGDPSSRGLEDLETDLLNGHVSREAALGQYGLSADNPASVTTEPRRSDP